LTELPFATKEKDYPDTIKLHTNNLFDVYGNPNKIFFKVKS